MPNAAKCQEKMWYEKMMLPLQLTTLGDAFRLNGYRTGYHGKWHLGDEEGRGSPLEHGFEISIGATHKGAVQTHFYPYVDNKKINKTQPAPPMSERANGTYIADHLTDETISTIKKFKNDPFFVVMSHYAVHTPIEAPKKLVWPYRKKRARLKKLDRFVRDHGAKYRTSQDNANYGGMITAVDNSVGRIMSSLVEMGLDRNTTIVFTSDNGGLASFPRSTKRYKMTIENTSTTNRPYRHGKTWLYEGGVRVPLIVRVPDGDADAAAGKESGFQTIGTDVYPTLLDLAGLSLRPGDHMDGISIAPAVKTPTDGVARGSPLFWHFVLEKEKKRKLRGQKQCSAVVDGGWKLLDFFSEGKDGTRELYNIEKDPFEIDDVSDQYPEVKERLFATLEDWRNNWADEDFYRKEMDKEKKGICKEPWSIGKRLAE